MSPKHIQIARTEGPEAGLAAFMAAPSSRRWDSYKILSRKRTPETRLAAYCKLFKEQLEAPQPAPRLRVHAPDHNTTVPPQIDLMEAIRKKLNIETVTEDELEPDDAEQPEGQAEQMKLLIDLINTIMGHGEAQKDAPTAGIEKRPKRPQVVKGSGIISSGIAWEVLNTSGEFPAPSDPDAVATNGQLYRLNVSGLMGEAVMRALDN